MSCYVLFTWIVAGLLASPAAAATTGDLKLLVRNGRPVVDGVYVNGHGPYRFLLDTGSTYDHIDPALASAIGLTPTLRTTLVSSTGAVSASGSAGADVQLGEACADEQILLFVGMDAVHRIGADIQGVLGQVFLSRFDYLLDLRNGRVRFGPQAAPAGPHTAFTTVAGRPVVSTSLGPLVLDSGAPTMIRFGVWTGQPVGQLATAAGLTPVRTVVSTLVIDGRTVWHGAALAIGARGETGADGLLPIGTFKSVFVCNSERYLVLELERQAPTR
jgi:hypothetical protein